MSAPLLEVRELVKRYPLGGGLFGSPQVVHALEGVSLALRAGETLAVVGESGCGKSTLARCVLRLEAPTSGSILVAGRDIVRAKGRELRRLRKRVQIVFQDPYSSLNPRRTVFQAVADALRLHDICKRKERRARVERLLNRVGLGADHMDRLPHELSGGQRQRVAVARALAVEPEVLVCDEPVSALDVSVQAQVINLLKRLQRELGISYLFISHNLGLVLQIADRVAVMYLGRVVELAETRALRARALHPYSEALLSAVPVADPQATRRKRHLVLAGEIPSATEMPAGCAFASRCPYRQEICTAEAPALRLVEERLVRCHFAGEWPAPAAAVAPGL
ncbi:MAG: ABC transporter ATP-binding protein [Alphaproteobacteria bacterium]